jgi:DNA (cytosine-5)-methyltransferase 1
MPVLWLQVVRREGRLMNGAAAPAYHVPSMVEIAALPWNGLTAASTFSGCGGSSLGYRMAGFRVLWANEFVPAARDSYRANAAPYTVLDGRDIREVTGADVLRAAGVRLGDLDLFDGSPPCASFSTSGKREAGWGKVKKYSDTTQRTDDLFYEYARLVREIQPRTFVAENVSGLVKGTAKGYFIRILTVLRDCGYRVEARLLDAQWLGVPQARQRLIFVGVRNDLNAAPIFPAPLPYRYTVGDVLPHLTHQGDNAGYGGGSMRPTSHPSPTIGASPQTGNGRFPPSAVLTVAGLPADPETGKALIVKPSTQLPPGTYARRLNLQELRRICGFPDDFTLTGTYEQRWERLGRAVPPVMMSHIAAAVRDKILTSTPGRDHVRAA